MVAVTAVLACAVWAFLPAQIPGAEAASPVAPAAPPGAPEPDRPGFDPGAFQARLWHAPAVPEVAPQPVESSREMAVALQLISLIESGDVLSAAIYDPAQDRMAIVKAGDAVGAYTIESITWDGVEIARDGRPQRLALREDR